MNNKPLLNYSIDPGKVYIASQATLTITMENPLDGETITFHGGRNGDEIDITFPAPPECKESDALTDSIDFQGEITKGFTVGRSRSGGPFIVIPDGTQTLTPGNAIKVSFSPINVNGQTGTPVLKIQEYIGTNEAEKNISVTKLPQELSVIAWLDPKVVGLKQTSTLFWRSFGGTNVDVTGFAGGTGTKSFPVAGDPPYPGKTTVTVPDNEAQRSYTLTVNTNDGKHKQTIVSLTQHKPVINSFGPKTMPQEPIPVDAEININWDTLFGHRASLQTPSSSQAQRVPPQITAPISITPGQDVVKGSVDIEHIPGKATYQLGVTGFGEPATACIEFELAPVKVLWLKYQNMDAKGNLSGITWRIDPKSWIPVELNPSSDHPELYQLTVHQPGGGELNMWLGPGDDVHPQVQYFNAAHGKDGKWTLTWVTANLTSLVLQPDGTKLSADKIAKGSVEVTPKATTTYVLQAQGKNGETIISSLTVNV